jgi:hypothetical protein
MAFPRTKMGGHAVQLSSDDGKTKVINAAMLLDTIGGLTFAMPAGRKVLPLAYVTLATDAREDGTACCATTVHAPWGMAQGGLTVQTQLYDSATFGSPRLSLDMAPVVACTYRTDVVDYQPQWHLKRIIEMDDRLEYAVERARSSALGLSRIQTADLDAIARKVGVDPSELVLEYVERTGYQQRITPVLADPNGLENDRRVLLQPSALDDMYAVVAVLHPGRLQLLMRLTAVFQRRANSRYHLGITVTVEQPCTAVTIATDQERGCYPVHESLESVAKSAAMRHYDVTSFERTFYVLSITGTF